MIKPESPGDICLSRKVIKVPKAFLSYSSKDSAFVSKLATDLRTAGIGVWFDQWEIHVGESIIEKIQQGINENDFLIVVLSPRSVESPWVKRELNAATVSEIEARRVAVLPIVVEDCAIPALFREKRYADFRSSYNDGFQQLVRSIIVLSEQSRQFRPDEAVESEWQYVRRLSGTPVDKLFLMLTEDPVLRLWSVPDGKLRRAFFVRSSGFQSITDACLSADGKYAIVAIRTRGSATLGSSELHIFDCSTGKSCGMEFLKEANAEALWPLRNGFLVGLSSGKIAQISYSNLNSLNRNQLIRTEPFGSAPFPIATWSVAPSEDYIAVSGATRTGIALVSIQGGFSEKRICSETQVDAVAVGAGGKFVAYSSGSDGFTIVDVATGSEGFRGHTDQVSSIAFSGNGELLAAGDWDGGLYIYESPDWNLVGSVRAHERKVGSIAFCSSDQYIVSGGGFDIPTVAIWDCKTGRRICTIRGQATE